MKFISSGYSDVGIKKPTNQDSYTCKIANTPLGEIAFAVICDGMGGLEKGEVASAHMIKSFSNWFSNEFVVLLSEGRFDDIPVQWNSIIQKQNEVIAKFGDENGCELGTTITAVLVIGSKYWFVHVGDTRLYHIKENNIQIVTEDQTFIAREIKRGNMTPQQAAKDPRRNMLLQCVGASRIVEPQFGDGVINSNEVMMLCSDGFRHKISDDEIYNHFKPSALNTIDDLQKNSKILVELNKERNETDNITVLLIKSI